MKELYGKSSINNKLDDEGSKISPILPFNVIKNKIDFEKWHTAKETKDDELKEIKNENDDKPNLAKLKKIAKRKANSLPTKDPSLEERTICVGNVSITTQKKEVKSFFSKYGKVEIVRFRGITPKASNVTKKEAAIWKKHHPEAKTLIAYVRFKELSAKERALTADGQELGGLCIRVNDAQNSSSSSSSKNTIFVGNLTWEAKKEDLHSFFKSCGAITKINVPNLDFGKDSKGIAFITFESKDSVELALNFDGKIFLKRPLRIKRISKKKKDDVTPKTRLATPSSGKGKGKKWAERRRKGKKRRMEEKGEKKPDFCGDRVVEEGKEIKMNKRQGKTKTELRKMFIAKRLTMANKSKS